MRRRVVDRKKFSIKEGKGICAKEWSVESRGNLVVSWCTSSWTWRKMKDNRVSNKELLVTRNDKRYKKICKGL